MPARTSPARWLRRRACSASALAFAAHAYEAANGEPDGPLPAITGHACDSGYAIMNFVQDAPPPGYRSSLAFRSTPDGWTFIGAGDIQQGDFSIPDEVYARMADDLAARDGMESADLARIYLRFEADQRAATTVSRRQCRLISRSEISARLGRRCVRSSPRDNEW